MSERNTLVRSLHDVGLAAWFGGSLMGVVGLNGGASTANSPRERIEIASAGWKRWSPLQWTAIAAHAVGGIALVVANKERLAVQEEGRVNTGVKAALEIVAGLATLYSAILGGRMDKHADEGGSSVTEPNSASSKKLASAQRQQSVAQWITPALTAVLIVLGAQQGEQQRPVAGLLKSKKRR